MFISNLLEQLGSIAENVELGKERLAQSDVNAILSKTLENVSKLSESFDIALEKWEQSFRRADKQFQIQELEKFTEIYQEEMEAKEQLLAVYRRRLIEEAQKKQNDSATFQTFYQLLQNENEILRNKLLAQEQFMLNEKSVFRKGFDKTIELLIGGKEGKPSLIEAANGLREEVKKAQLQIIKNGKRKPFDGDTYFKQLDRIGSELTASRRALEVNQHLKVTEDIKAALAEAVAINSKLRADYGPSRQTAILSALKDEISDIKNSLNRLRQDATKSNTWTANITFDFKNMYKNIEESIRKLIRECNNKDAKIQDLSQTINSKNRGAGDILASLISEQTKSAAAVKSQLLAIAAQLKESAQKPLIDFTQLRNEVHFALDAQDELSAKIQRLSESVKRIYEENLLRTKLTEEAFSSVDSKMMIRKLNELRNEFFKE